MNDLTSSAESRVVRYRDELVTLHNGDALTVLSTLPAQTASCVVTSPPYYGLRDYGVDGQYGREETPAAFVEVMRQTFVEVRRVLEPTGTLWLNIGDTYNSPPVGRFNGGGRKMVPGHAASGSFDKRAASGLPDKNLLGVPWMVAHALQRDGWILRNAIVWHKPNGMPTSVRDRLTAKYEMIFLLTRTGRYHFDLDAIRTETGGNPGDVWTINNKPSGIPHYATFPVEVPARCITAGCREGGLVLDPFSGAGTTGVAALAASRRYLGIELNPDYHAIAVKRLGARPTVDDDTSEVTDAA